jgi:hypothetical protein
VSNPLRSFLPLALAAVATTAAAAPANAPQTPAIAFPASLPARLAALQHVQAGGPMAKLPRAPAPSPNGSVPWLEQDVFATDGIQEDTFGSAVAIDGDVAIISAPQPGSDSGGIPAGPGRAYIFRNLGGTWVQTDVLTADDGEAGDFFGYAVAIQGDTALVGAHFATIDGHVQQGAAYVFHHADGAWTQTQKLVAGDGAAQSFFGAAVALDGDHAFVGSYAATIGGHFGQGAVYAYSGVAKGSLQPSGEITNPEGAANDQFGYAVAAHGGSVMIGSPNTKVGDHAAQGAVFLYENDGNGWTQAQQIVADDGLANDAFGLSVSYDDTHALVGVPVGNGFLGEFYAFARDGGAWTQTQKILPPDGATDIFYAVSVALSGDRAVVTYPGYAGGQGRVDLFGLDTGGDWNLLQAYEHPSGDPSDLFPYYGFAAGISGGHFLVGAYGRKVGDNLYQGAAYFYTRDALFADGFDGG